MAILCSSLFHAKTTHTHTHTHTRTHNALSLYTHTCPQDNRTRLGMESNQSKQCNKQAKAQREEELQFTTKGMNRKMHSTDEHKKKAQGD